MVESISTASSARASWPASIRSRRAWSASVALTWLTLAWLALSWPTLGWLVLAVTSGLATDSAVRRWARTRSLAVR